MTFENFSEAGVLEIILDSKHQSRDWYFFLSKTMGFHNNIIELEHLHKLLSKWTNQLLGL